MNGIEAGELTEYDNPTEYVFRYRPDYIKHHRQAVSLTMPVREEEYRSPNLFPYFFNMLSEGENRAAQASIHHLDKNDDFGIMLETAQYDTPGVVTVKPVLI